MKSSFCEILSWLNFIWNSLFLLHLPSDFSQSVFEHVILPGWNCNWAVDISINIPDCKMIWINVCSASHNDWTVLIKLVFLSWRNWILDRCAPASLTTVGSCPSCSFKCCSTIVKRLAAVSCLSHLTILTPVSTIKILTFLDCVKQTFALLNWNCF